MRSLFISLFLCSACRNDAGVKEFNSLPSIQIISHGDASVFDEGIPTLLVAQTSDDNHEATTLLTNWYADDDLLCEDVLVDADGLSSCEAVMPASATLIRATVRDPQDGGGEDVIIITVTANAPPIAEIVRPVENDIFTVNESVPFEAIVLDPEDSPESLVYTLESDIDGPLNVSVTPDSSGLIQDGLTLNAGAHRLTLTVTDSGGKTGTDSLGLTVLSTNSTPECEITTPLDGDISTSGPIYFSGTATDLDQPNDTLTVQWSSSLDGELNVDPPDSDGLLEFNTDLSSGTHEITLEVDDNANEPCTTTIGFTFASGPVLTILSPVDGDYYSIGDPIEFTAQLSNTVDATEDLVVNWESSIEGLFANSQTDSAGISSTSSGLTLNGPHIITASAIDSSNQQGLASISININAPPTAPTLSIVPVPATTLDNVTVLASGSIDYDNDPISYAYSWSLNGIVSNSSNTDTLPSTATTKGDIWTVTVTPTDPLSFGTPESLTFEITNAAPTISSISIAPTPPNNRDTLVCSPVAFDPDPQDQSTLQLSYLWENLSTGVVLGTNDTFTLSPSSASVGDQLQCTATVFDADGAQGNNSATVTISNTDPTVSSVSISPASPDKEETVTCSAIASDPDGDVPTISYEWSSNTIILGSGNNLDITTTSIGRSDPLTCTATASDGNGGGASDSFTTTLTNATPTLSAVQILVNGVVEPSAQAADALTCDPINFYDADGDSPQYIYQWRVNGNAMASSSTISGLFSNNDTVTCEVTPFDGSAFGASQSTSINIENTPPEVLSAVLAPATPNTTDTINVVVTDTDDDNDAITYAYEWYVSGNFVSTASSLDPSLTTIGDTVSLTLTPSDLEGSGSSFTSNVETIVNAPPSINNITITPNPPTNRDSISCVVVPYDPDPNDTATIDYILVNNTTNAQLTTTDSVLLTTGTASVGDSITCTATVTDGSGESSTESVSVVVQNTLPTIGGLSISPNSPGRSDTATCNSTIDDLDDDTLTITTEWSSAGNLLGSSSIIDLSLINIFRGDPLTCTVSVNDGNGGYVNDNQTVTVANSVPSISSLSILVNGVNSNAALALDTLSCTPQGYNDIDGDPPQYIYQWRINGNPVSSSSTLNSGFSRNDLISCEATPFDGFGFGSSQTAAVTILNSAPVITNLTLSPSTPSTNSTITANVVSSDADGDTVSFAYNWFVNSTPVSSSSSLTSNFFTQGDSLYLLATPTDTIDNGATVTSSTLVVGNTAPSAPSILITPSNAVVGLDDLVCNVIVPSSDTDGDSVSYSMSWLRNGASYTANTTTTWTGDTIPANALQINDTWTCIATPNDGIDDGPTATASLFVDLCVDGSIEECAAVTCFEILQDGLSAGDGNYFLDPNGSGADEYYCDMTNGGWTGITFPQADSFLDGTLTEINPASIGAIDPVHGPYTRDSSGSHTYHYTFDFDPGFTEFRLLNYDVRANALSGDTSDINPGTFTMTNWNNGYGSSHGDVGFGGASQVGPVATLAVDYGSDNSCQSCTYTMSNNTYSIGATDNRFRIGWGESGGQYEGWYPWYDGLILLRE